MHHLHVVLTRGHYSQWNMLSLQALYRYKIPTRIPEEESAAIRDLASRCDVDEEFFTRLVQHAVTKHFLAQPAPGHVSHTALSAMLANSPGLMHFTGILCKVLWPAATRIIDAHEKWPGPPMPNQTGFNLAVNKPETMFEIFKEDPPRAELFHLAMSTMQNLADCRRPRALEAFDWASLGADATAVDVGGGNAAFAMALAEMYSQIGNILVQDILTVVENTVPSIPEALRERITMQAHDVFEP